MDEHRLSEAFSHGERLSRQLRLTEEEARWLTQHTPAALTPLGEGWYNVEFQEAYR